MHIKYEHKQVAVSFSIAEGRRNISWRIYGDRGQFKRPIRHRFDIKGGSTEAEAFVWELQMQKKIYDAAFRSLWRR